jgi:hypothetical protein
MTLTLGLRNDIVFPTRYKLVMCELKNTKVNYIHI